MSTSSNQDNIPRLPERPNNSDVFCTYFIFNPDHSQVAFQWKNSPPLKRNFDLYERNNHEFAQFCSMPDGIINILQFWKNIAIDASPIVQQWERQNRRELALNHLTSYLEKSCYYATKKVSLISRNHSWEDYLSSARIFINNSDKLIKLLRSYDDSQASLNTYIQNILIKEIQNKQDICKSSQWRLLVEESEIQLRKALRIHGIQEPNLSQYLFARKCFKPVYSFNKVHNPALRKSGDKWLDPDSEDFQAAAQSYNAEKSLCSAPHEVSAGSNVSREQIQVWMKTCIMVLQNHSKSLENIQEEDNKELCDQSQPEDINLEAEESDLEANPRFKEIKSAFEKEFDRLELDQHKILLLYYGAGLKQKELEVKLGTSQSAISRRLHTIKKQLLKTLIQKSRSHIWMTNSVVEWLHKNFRAPRHSDLIEAALFQATKELSSKEQQVLLMRYGEQVNEQNIATQLGISLLDVNTIIDQSQYKLETHLIKKLYDWEKKYVDEWLKSFCKSKILATCRTLNLYLDIEDDQQIIDRFVEEHLENLENLIISKKGE